MLNELFQLAQRMQEPRLLMEAHRTQGASKLSDGELDVVGIILSKPLPCTTPRITVSMWRVQVLTLA